MNRDRLVGQDFAAAGARLKACRSKAGLSQAHLSRRLSEVGLKIHPTAISRIESGSRASTFVEIAWICQILDVDARDLVEAVTEPPPGTSIPRAMIRTFDGLEVDTIEPIPAHNLSARTTDLAYGGYWNCELTGGGCVQQFGDELLVGPDEEHLTLVSKRGAA